jgi:ATP-binding cassette, subfamily B, bacterial
LTSGAPGDARTQSFAAQHATSLRGYAALLRTYLWPHRARLFVLASLIAVSIAMQLVSPQIARQFIDGAARSPSTTYLATLALAFAATAILGNIAAAAATYVSETVAWSATNALRADLVEHTLGLDPTFHKAHTSGEMIERIDGDVTAMANFFSQFVVRMLATLALMLGVLIIVGLEDWRIGLALTMFALLTLFTLARLRHVAIPHFKARSQANAELSAFWEERLSGIEDIRSSGAEPHTLRQQWLLMRRVFKLILRGTLFGRIMFAAFVLSTAVGNVLALGSGALMLGIGAFTIGTVYLVMDYTGTLAQNLRQVAEQLDDLQNASAGIARTAELLAERSKIVSGAQTPAATGAAALRFERVTFVYEDDLPGAATAVEAAQPVLQDVSFALTPGRVLGLLGRTGSGKSTLTRLLFRFYDPTDGSINLDGLDTREWALSALRNRIGLVTQEVQLFQASVRNNLTFFDDAITDERIRAVLGELDMLGWLDGLKRGLDTELGSGNAGLSAGEAQLLAFARVFLQDPRLVVLDEASSRLDPATEQRIERAIDRLLSGRSAIIIAHHLATVQRADEILILEDGRVREYGARAELARRPDSRFATLLRTGMQEVLA